MGQLWEVFNIDRRERGLAGGSKFHEFFPLDYTYDLHWSLQIPCLPKDVDEWLSRGTFVLQPGPIGTLSTELLDMIFEAVIGDSQEIPDDNFVGCIHLAITCKRLLSIAKPHILRALISRYAPAANCRLVCLGEYTDANDQAPPGMLTDVELKEIAATKVRWEDEGIRFSTPEELLEARCLYNFASEFYKSRYDVQQANLRFRFCHWASEDFFIARWELKKAPNPLREFDLHMVETLGGTGFYYTYPPHPSVLCNVSKGEYVRKDTLFVFRRCACDALLTHALLSRICYSPESSIMEELCGDEHVGKGVAKGPWAGDRFCITTTEDMPPPDAGAGWTEWRDVTEEVNGVLRRLWKSIMDYDFSDEETEEGSDGGGDGEDDEKSETTEYREDGGEEEYHSEEYEDSGEECEEYEDSDDCDE